MVKFGLSVSGGLIGEIVPWTPVSDPSEAVSDPADGTPEPTLDKQDSSMPRFSGFRKREIFAGFDPRLGKIDRLLSEAEYNIFLASRYWGSRESTVILLSVVGFILGTWDIGIGEISSGGDYNRAGILGDDSGFLHITDLSLILSLLSILCWIGSLAMIWASFPIMRENLVYLIIGMGIIQFGYIKAHADSPEFPFETEILGWTWVFVSNIVTLFLANFVVKRSVLETRDIHVQERHSHPDPRVFERAWEDHSLKAWSLCILLWIALLNASSWSSSHAVAPSPNEMSLNYFLIFSHVITGSSAILLLLGIVWLPQFMLGGSEERIQSYRAREVSGESLPRKRDEQGKCPVCNQQTAALRGDGGKIRAPCAEDGCSGKGEPGSECGKCENRIPTRVVCVNCGTSTPIGSHFGRVEIW